MSAAATVFLALLTLAEAYRIVSGAFSLAFFTQAWRRERSHYPLGAGRTWLEFMDMMMVERPARF